MVTQLAGMEYSYAMIVYDIKCSHDHVFEAWFKDSETFDEQVEAGGVSCPVCGVTDVEKALMAPRLNKGKSDQRANAREHMGRYVAAIHEMRRQVEKNCDYVGDKFAEEARKIHYGEAESRGIYGEATNDEASSLVEEGVEFHKIPWAPREDA
jgi:hypothetical protein